MTKTTCRIIASICACTFALASGVALATDPAPPVKLSIREPVKHNKAGGFVEGRDWNLEFRLTVPNALGFVELLGNGDTFEALVVSDADNCLEFDLGHPTYPGPFDSSCGDSVIEEVFFPFRSDPNDRSGVADIDQCDFLIEQPRLQDDPSTTPSASSNKAYLLAPDQAIPSASTPPTPRSMGPLTGGQTIGDCYGYGRDEDLPGLVVMVDVGAARVFDQNFDIIQVERGVRRIRNLAGFTSTVTRELKDRFGRSHVVAHMQIERGMLEPLVAFDARTGVAPDYIGSTFQRRIDSGPVETFSWVTQPTTSYSAAEIEELLATLPDTSSVKLRAVLVEGDAPSYIDDLDKNGKFTINDLILMGYTPLTNQAKRTINVIQQDKFEDFGGTLECPSFRVIAGIDLDGNNIGYFCQDGDGSSRSVKRVPQ
jgi:hypothetical protein